MSKTWVSVSMWMVVCVLVGRVSLFHPMCSFVGQMSIILRSRLWLDVVGNAIVGDDNRKFRSKSLSQEISNATSWILK